MIVEALTAISFSSLPGSIPLEPAAISSAASAFGSSGSGSASQYWRRRLCLEEETISRQAPFAAVQHVHAGYKTRRTKNSPHIYLAEEVGDRVRARLRRDHVPPVLLEGLPQRVDRRGAPRLRAVLTSAAA